MATARVSLPLTWAHRRAALPADIQIFKFFFYFTATVKGVIPLNVVCLKRWKQELLDRLFCLDRESLKAGFIF